MRAKARLILSMDGLVLKEIELAQGRLSIGRKPHNDIQIDNMAISGEHAVVVTILADSFLEDMNSTNGTLVNGKPVSKHFLQPDDVIELGKYRLTYMLGGPSSPIVEDFAPRGTTRSAPLNPASDVTFDATDEQSRVTGDPPAPLEENQGTPAAAVQLLHGPHAGREIPLTRALTTLGKHGLQMAVITKQPQGYFMTHVAGESFPCVNGRVIDAQAYPLRDHDIIEVAGIRMEFFLKG